MSHLCPKSKWSPAFLICNPSPRGHQALCHSGWQAHLSWPPLPVLPCMFACGCHLHSCACPALSVWIRALPSASTWDLMGLIQLGTVIAPCLGCWNETTYPFFTFLPNLCLLPGRSPLVLGFLLFLCSVMIWDTSSFSTKLHSSSSNELSGSPRYIFKALNQTLLTLSSEPSSLDSSLLPPILTSRTLVKAVSTQQWTRPTRFPLISQYPQQKDCMAFSHLLSIWISSLFN